MKNFKLLFAGLVAAGSLGLSACDGIATEAEVDSEGQRPSAPGGTSPAVDAVSMFPGVASMPAAPLPAGATTPPRADAGAPPPPVDAGTPPPPPPPPVDAGTPPPPPVDAGIPPPPPVDAGIPPPVDAGTPPPPVDGGAPLPSACLRVMPLGDSITLGVNGGYRNTLYSSLNAAGCGVNYVGSQFDQYTAVADKQHEGHPGFTIGDISLQVDTWLAGYQPEYVLLMIGTNDVAWWTAETGAQIAVRHAALVDKILAKVPNVWVIVGSIPPISSSLVAPNNVDRAQLGRDLNAGIQSRMATREAAGKRVRFADVYSKLTVSDLYDGVHPTQAAHAKVAAAFFTVLSPVTACMPAVSCGP